MGHSRILGVAQYPGRVSWFEADWCYAVISIVSTRGATVSMDMVVSVKSLALVERSDVHYLTLLK